METAKDMRPLVAKAVKHKVEKIIRGISPMTKKKQNARVKKVGVRRAGPCDNCGGKGYNTVFMQIGYPWDMPIKKMVGGKIFAKFCVCPKGARMQKRYSTKGAWEIKT